MNMSQFHNFCQFAHCDVVDVFLLEYVPIHLCRPSAGRERLENAEINGVRVVTSDAHKLIIRCYLSTVPQLVLDVGLLNYAGQRVQSGHSRPAHSAANVSITPLLWVIRPASALAAR